MEYAESEDNMKLFGTDGIRGRYGEHPITSEMALKIGGAFVDFFSRESERPKVIIGRDTRSSGEGLQNAVVRGVTGSGGEALVLGVLPSNAVSFFVQNERAQGGIMISASHNPAEENGFKFFSGSGFKFSDLEEEKFEKALLAGNFVDAGQSGLKARSLPVCAYRDFLAGSVKTRDLSGLRLAVDAGNGAASFIIEGLVKGLKADVNVINDQPNGVNINENCGALFPQQLQNLVKEKSLDAGIAFDGDADRLVMVDEKGCVIEGDSLIAMIALDMKKSGRLNQNTVVANDYSNGGLDFSLNKQGIRVVRVKTGDRFVSDELFENNYGVGGERSGHVIIPEFSKTADAVLVSLRMLEIMKREGRKLSELNSFVKFVPSVLINVEVTEKRDVSLMGGVRDAIGEVESLLAGKGRVFVRYSGTENKMRILVEGESENNIKSYADKIACSVRSEIGR